MLGHLCCFVSRNDINEATSLENVLTITVVWVSVLFLFSWSFIVTFWLSTFKFKHKYGILQSFRMVSSLFLWMHVVLVWFLWYVLEILYLAGVKILTKDQFCCNLSSHCVECWWPSLLIFYWFSCEPSYFLLDNVVQVIVKKILDIFANVKIVIEPHHCYGVVFCPCNILRIGLAYYFASTNDLVYV